MIGWRWFCDFINQNFFKAFEFIFLKMKQVIFLIFLIFGACESKKTSSIGCKDKKSICNPLDSADYTHIISNIYRGRNGSLYEKKLSDTYHDEQNCCQFTARFDSTLGYEEERQSLDKIIDINSFVDIDSSSYSKDKGHVYGYSNNSNGGFRYIVEEADPLTFRRLADYRWAKDKNFVYCNGMVLEGLNLQKIELLYTKSSTRLNYIKDDKNVFYEYHKIENADAKTFKVVERSEKEDYDAIDKYRKYILENPKE
jgi:DKNYY family